MELLKSESLFDKDGGMKNSITQSWLMTREEVKEKFGEDAMFPKSIRMGTVKIPVFGKRIPRKKKGNFYIVKDKPGRFKFYFPPGFKGLYEQPKGKLVPYRRESFDLSWMKPVIQKFTTIGKKTTNLINKLYGRRIRK